MPRHVFLRTREKRRTVGIGEERVRLAVSPLHHILGEPRLANAFNMSHGEGIAGTVCGIQ